jgi:hypothetical protein
VALELDELARNKMRVAENGFQKLADGSVTVFLTFTDSFRNVRDGL